MVAPLGPLVCLLTAPVGAACVALKPRKGRPDTTAAIACSDARLTSCLKFAAEGEPKLTAPSAPTQAPRLIIVR